MNPIVLCKTFVNLNLVKEIYILIRFLTNHYLQVNSRRLNPLETVRNPTLD